MTHSLSLNVQPLEGGVGVVFHAGELDAVEVQAGKHATMKLTDGGRETVVVDALAEPLGGRPDLADDLLVRLGPLPEDLGMTLDEVAVDAVDVEVGVDLVLIDLVAHRDGVLEPAQPIPRTALPDIARLGQVVRQDNDG